KRSCAPTPIVCWPPARKAASSRWTPVRSSVPPPPARPLPPPRPRPPAARWIWTSWSMNKSACQHVDTLQRGQQSPTAVPKAPVSPFGGPFDKIYPKTARSVRRTSHTILGQISLEVSPPSAHVRRRGRILNAESKQDSNGKYG